MQYEDSLLKIHLYNEQLVYNYITYQQQVSEQGEQCEIQLPSQSTGFHFPLVCISSLGKDAKPKEPKLIHIRCGKMVPK